MTAANDGTVQAEAVVFSLRRHGRVLTFPVLVLLGLAGASGFYIGRFSEPWLNWVVALVALALALLFGIGPLLAWLTNRTTITTRRVIVRRGFFVQRRTEVLLAQIREVRTRRNLVQRLFGSGSIELLVGSDAPLVIRDVPASGIAAQALQELIAENYRRELPQ